MKPLSRFLQVQTSARGLPRTLASDTPARLLLRWKSVLRFRIGSDDVPGLQQLPNTEDFPDALPTADLCAGYALGEVLGVAALKVFRPASVECPADMALDPLGAWLEDLAKSDFTFDRARLQVVGRVVEMALIDPARLPVLIARLDALDNDDLHRMALAAVQGHTVAPDVFEGLME